MMVAMPVDSGVINRINLMVIDQIVNVSSIGVSETITTLGLGIFIKENAPTQVNASYRRKFFIE
jgi:hypothetical protein